MKIQVVLTIISTILETLLYAGVVFGWSSLVPILISEDFFAENCQNNSIINETCDDQKNALNLIFTVSSSSAALLCFLPGFLMDQFGLWSTRVVVLGMIGLGFLLAGISATLHISALLYAAFPLISVGGNGLLVTNYGISGFSEKYKGTIINLISGSVDSSSVVFLVFRSLYRLGVRLDHMFYFCSSLTILFYIRTFLLMPKKTLPSELPVDFKYGYKDLSCFTGKRISKLINEPEEVTQILNVASKVSLKSSLKKPMFWSNVYFSCIILLCFIFFIGNFNNWIKTKVDDENIASSYNTIFGMLLCSGFFFSSVSGTIIDVLIKMYKKTLDLKSAEMKAVAFTQLLCCLCLFLALVFSLIPNIEVQWLTLLFIVLTRSLFFGTQASFLSMCLPTKHFGSLYSITFVISGLFLLLQFPLSLLISGVMKNDFTLFYICFLIMISFAMMHPVYLMSIVKSQTEK